MNLGWAEHERRADRRCRSVSVGAFVIHPDLVSNSRLIPSAFIIGEALSLIKLAVFLILG